MAMPVGFKPRFVMQMLLLQIQSCTSKVLSDAFYACWCKCSFQSAVLCVPTTADVDCDPSGSTSQFLLSCNRQFANARAGMLMMRN